MVSTYNGIKYYAIYECGECKIQRKNKMDMKVHIIKEHKNVASKSTEKRKYRKK